MKARCSTCVVFILNRSFKTKVSEYKDRMETLREVKCLSSSLLLGVCLIKVIPCPPPPPNMIACVHPSFLLSSVFPPSSTVLSPCRPLLNLDYCPPLFPSLCHKVIKLSSQLPHKPSYLSKVTNGSGSSNSSRRRMGANGNDRPTGIRWWW